MPEDIIDIIYKRDHFLKKILEDSTSCEESLRLLRFLLWENPDVTSIIFNEIGGLVRLFSSKGKKWISVDSSGFQWIPVDSSGFQWIPVDSSGFQWIPVDPSGFQWIPVDSSGSQWIPVDSSGSQNPLGSSFSL
jgi:hypothetical protein